MKKSIKSKVIFLVLSCITVIAGLVAICLSPIFNINRINIKGNKHYTKSQLIEIINIRVGENWFKKIAKNTKLSPQNIMMYRYFDGESNIKKLCPYIKDVKIRVSGLGEYNIEVIERTPKAQVSYLASYIIIDKEGVALDIVENAQNNLPKLNGVSLEKVSLGTQLHGNQNEIEAFCKIYNLIMDSNKDNFYNIIDYIDLSNLKDVKIFLDGRILVCLGNIEDINQYIINYAKEIFTNNINKEDEGVLKFRNGKNPTFTKKSYA